MLKNVHTLNIGPAATSSQILPPIVDNGIRYRARWLDSRKYGRSKFLLRSDDGELFGVYGRNAQATLSAVPLVPKLTTDNPFRGVDFFEGDDGALLLGG